MDYQQVRLLDLGWLVCAIEGEGTLTLVLNNRPKRGYNYWYFVPYCMIANTELPFIEKFMRICKEFNIGCYKMAKKPLESRKICYSVRIAGMKRMENLLNLIEEHLVIKKEQAKIIREFIAYRKTLPPKAPQGEYEKSLRDKIQSLNKFGKPKFNKNLNEHTSDFFEQHDKGRWPEKKMCSELQGNLAEIDRNIYPPVINRS
jgi:hypothetical protein